MAKFSIPHFTRAAGRGLVGFRRGQTEAEVLKRQAQQRALELSLRLAPLAERDQERQALDAFLGEQSEGKDLAGRGLNPQQALGIYSGRLADLRSRRTTPAQAETKDRRTFLDLKARAQADADYIARTNQSPSPAGIFAYLRAKAIYNTLDDETLRGIAAESVGAKRPADVDREGLRQRIRTRLESMTEP